MEELTTMTNQELTNKELKSYTTKLKTCGTNIRKNYLKIAHLLTEIDNTECYLDDGFEDVQDYASKVLGIQKTTTYNLLKIGRDFISESGDRTVLTDKGDDYGVSQLQALVTVGVDKAKELHGDGTIDPSMSVRQIKAIVKGLNGQPDRRSHRQSEDDTVDTTAKEHPDETPVFGTISFCEDGTIIPLGIVPDTFCQKVEELFKELFEDFETLKDE